ncbi:hypothetical protein Hamer_G016399 [Homarus americanus]|uniref:Uncharacterized protein n=1 Tax=Homarus americanus TaxID=6706 RepID=A0A8J5N784_HOMAM|nr:hypothetical protein Hamer_G016399 [Homarus americanus]
MPLFPHLAKSQDSRQQQKDLLRETVQSVQSIPAAGYNSRNEDQINKLLGADKAPESIEEMLGEENQVQQETFPQIVQKPMEPTTRDLSMFLGVYDNLEERMLLVEPNYDAREMMMGLFNKIRGRYQEKYNKKVNDHQQDLITRYLSRKQEENRQVIEAIERVEVEDEGEEDCLKLASLPENFLVVAEAVVEEGGDRC